MADSSLYQRYNVDNVFNRSVISGLLYLLNHKIIYEQTWQDNVTEKVEVPFMYNFAYAKDQRFAQDNYTFFGRECFSEKMIDGKFDMLPRFAVTYSGSQIDSQNITNRFIKAKYQVVTDGSIESFTAYLYSIPMTLNFELEGWIDNIETAFKIEQKIYETFYKNQTFRVLYKGMSVNCCVGFPESISSGEKTVSYSFEQENQLKMTFNLSVECYYPSFDESVKVPQTERILYDISHYTMGMTPKDKSVTLKLQQIPHVYCAGDNMRIRWTAESPTSLISNVILYYITNDNGDKHIIDVVNGMDEIYDWSIPKYISTIRQPVITFIDNDKVSLIRKPRIVVKPEYDGRVLSGDFDIQDGGKFTKAGYIQISCEVSDGEDFIIHDGYVGVINKDGVLESVSLYTDIKEELPPDVDFSIMNTKPFSYEKDVDFRKITLGISYPLDKEIYDEIDNILII